MCLYVCLYVCLGAGPPYASMSTFMTAVASIILWVHCSATGPVTTNSSKFLSKNLRANNLSSENETNLLSQTLLPNIQVEDESWSLSTQNFVEQKSGKSQKGMTNNNPYMVLILLR